MADFLIKKGASVATKDNTGTPLLLSVANSTDEAGTIAALRLLVGIALAPMISTMFLKFRSRSIMELTSTLSAHLMVQSTRDLI